VRVLVFGGGGMLGHMVARRLRECGPVAVAWTTRQGERGGIPFEVTAPPGRLRALLARRGPFDFVVNCITVLQSAINEDNPEDVDLAERVNGEFPQRVAVATFEHGARVIHVSTDGVFEPHAGRCVESTLPTPPNIYGRTKLQGEVTARHVVNVRCSPVGPALGRGQETTPQRGETAPRRGRGLLEWLLDQPAGSRINGFTDHLWVGCTTWQVAELCRRLIADGQFEMAAREGSVHHFCPCAPVSKYELLHRLAALLRPDIEVCPTESGRPVTRQLDTENRALYDGCPKYAPPDAALVELAAILSPRRAAG
jgi:dTDP-4-dehydrorhamnose reductase